MKVVSFVPIKMNSQRLPHKNILPLGEHAMCWYIFSELLKCENIDEVYVYCSDSAIVDYIPQGVHFLERPTYLDKDEVKGAEIYKRFMEVVDADVYVLAHATSPLVRAESIREAVSHVLSGENDSAFSVKEEKTFAWCHGHPINYSLENVVRTQDLEPVYLETSAFFVFEKELFCKHGRRIGFRPWMSVLNADEAVDVDTASDFQLAKYYMEVRNQCEQF